MPEFCTCGAKLPPDARFCHKCGRPQYEEPAAQEEAPLDLPAPDAAPPPAPVPASAEIGFGNSLAVRIGFLAALLAVMLGLLLTVTFPPAQLAVFIAAGFLAVYLYRRRTGQRLSQRGGARLGWITGVFSFAIVMVQFTIGVVATSRQGGLAALLRQQFPSNDQRTQQIVDMLQQPASLTFIVLMALAALFVILTGLPMLGGWLGAKLMAREH